MNSPIVYTSPKSLKIQSVQIQSNHQMQPNQLTYMQPQTNNQVRRIRVQKLNRFKYKPDIGVQTDDLNDSREQRTTSQQSYYAKPIKEVDSMEFPSMRISSCQKDYDKHYYNIPAVKYQNYKYQKPQTASNSRRGKYIDTNENSNPMYYQSTGQKKSKRTKSSIGKIAPAIETIFCKTLHQGKHSMIHSSRFRAVQSLFQPKNIQEFMKSNNLIQKSSSQNGFNRKGQMFNYDPPKLAIQTNIPLSVFQHYKIATQTYSTKAEKMRAVTNDFNRLAKISQLSVNHRERKNQVIDLNIMMENFPFLEKYEKDLRQRIFRALDIHDSVNFDQYVRFNRLIVLQDAGPHSTIEFLKRLFGESNGNIYTATVKNILRKLSPDKKQYSEMIAKFEHYGLISDDDSHIDSIKFSNILANQVWDISEFLELFV